MEIVFELLTSQRRKIVPIKSVVASKLRHTHVETFNFKLSSVTSLTLSIPRRSGYSSNRLVFGRELNTPLSLLAENRKDFELEPMKESRGAETTFESRMEMDTQPPGYFACSPSSPSYSPESPPAGNGS